MAPSVQAAESVVPSTFEPPATELLQTPPEPAWTLNTASSPSSGPYTIARGQVVALIALIFSLSVHTLVGRTINRSSGNAGGQPAGFGQRIDEGLGVGAALRASCGCWLP
jgi:hypothetical protein